MIINGFWVRPEASETRSLSGDDGHDIAHGFNGPSEYVGDAPGQDHVIDQVPRPYIVERVHYQIHTIGKFLNVVRADCRINGLDFYLGIGRPKAMSRCLSLGDTASRVLFVVKNLSVEIMQLGAVLIGNSDKTDSCPNKKNSNEGPEGSEACYEDTGFLYLILAPFSEYSQELVPTISRNLRFHVTTVETGTLKQK